jgi:hypothetical protein
MRAGKRLTAQDHVEAAAPAVAAMRGPDRGNSLSVARHCQPIMDGGANASALDRRIAWPGMTGDQQEHPFLVNQRLLQGAVDGLPRPLQVVTMQVDDAIRLDRPRRKRRSQLESSVLPIA